MNKDIVSFADEISNFIFTSKYSRFNEKLGRRETWEETIGRLEDMHLRKYSYLSDEDKQKIKWAFDLVRAKRIIPSMRSLQFGGKAIEAHELRLYNCCMRHIDSIRSFAEVMYALLAGCGVGIGLSKYFLKRLPDLVNADDKTGTVLTYVIEDDIEGWSDSVEALLNCYFRNTPYTGRKIVFDYSRIRKKGAILKTGGGKAPGYRGLKNTHTKIKKLLDHIIEDKGQIRLKSIDAYDILMHCADAVLSGGIRRSATSVMFDADDMDMMDAKTMLKASKHSFIEKDGTVTLGGVDYQLYVYKVIVDGLSYEVKLKEFEVDNLKKNGLISWLHIHPQRGRSNNSVTLLKSAITKSKLKEIIERTRQFGEPGFALVTHIHQLLNPCFEISTIPVTSDGVCGMQMCNLTSANGALIDTVEKFKECVEGEAILGTLQAGYTHFPYLSKAAEELTSEEALLGCSLTGMMDNPDILLNPENQREMANLAVKTNQIWAKKLGINPAARVTCNKPEGTGTLALSQGETFVASGIHPHHAPKYFRRVQANTTDPVYKFFKKLNPHVCEASVWSANHTDDVITFPIEIKKKAIFKNDLSAIEHLKFIKSTQQNWVIYGISPSNKKIISHNVSCTVIVRENEWDKVIDYLFDNKEFFTAVSFISASGDKDYPQAPMEAVVNEQDEKRWNDIISNFKHVDYTKLKEEEDNTTLAQEGSCYGGACQII
jgi:ribonucleoside-diphosphate reductase alpha chain